MSFWSTLAAAIWVDAAEVNKASVRTWAGVAEDKIDNGAWTVVAKQADEARNTTTTLADDAELGFDMEANAKYLVRWRIFFDTAATPDFKWGLTGPASPTRVRAERRAVAPGATAYSGIGADAAYPSAVAVTGSGTTGGFVAGEAVVENGATAGRLAFAWAQNTSDGASTSVLRGSYLEHRKVTV